MNNVIDCICRNLPHSEVRVTSPTLIKDQEFVVIGFDCFHTDIPIVLTQKLNTESWVNIPYNLQIVLLILL